MRKKSIVLRSMLAIAILCIGAISTFAQTSAFSYQGRLSELGAPVTGTRYFRFTLFDENGVPVPGTLTQQTLMVTAGVFNTSLDFGPAGFPGPNRSLEVAVKVNPGDPYTVLNPRQPILSAPYSIKSKTADNAGNADPKDPWFSRRDNPQTRARANQVSSERNHGGLPAREQTIDQNAFTTRKRSAIRREHSQVSTGISRPKTR